MCLVGRTMGSCGQMLRSPWLSAITKSAVDALRCG